MLSSIQFRCDRALVFWPSRSVQISEIHLAQAPWHLYHPQNSYHPCLQNKEKMENDRQQGKRFKSQVGELVSDGVEGMKSGVQLSACTECIHFL